MSHNPRLTIHTSIHNVSVSHRGRQAIHDSLPCNKAQITRPLYLKKHAHNKQDRTITRDHYLYNNSHNTNETYYYIARYYDLLDYRVEILTFIGMLGMIR